MILQLKYSIIKSKTAMNNLKSVEEKINLYSKEEILELKKIILGYDDDSAKWEILTGSKE